MCRAEKDPSTAFDFAASWIKGDKPATERFIESCISKGTLSDTDAWELEKLVQRHLEPILANPEIQAMNLRERLDLLSLIAKSYDSK